MAIIMFKSIITLTSYCYKHYYNDNYLNGREVCALERCSLEPWLHPQVGDADSVAHLEGGVEDGLPPQEHGPLVSFLKWKNHIDMGLKYELKSITLHITYYSIAISVNSWILIISRSWKLTLIHWKTIITTYVFNFHAAHRASLLLPLPLMFAHSFHLYVWQKWGKIAKS